jgi:ABC-type multidrug transport system fused ATPase/permease subunit
MAEGRIIDVGSHSELMAKKGYYSRMAMAQSLD